MSTQAISPLRVQKAGSNTSPNKTAFLQNRPLAEVSPMALRRNSPSFPRTSLSKHDSPNSSPFNTSTNSPRMFWNTRDPASPQSENKSPYDAPGSPSKRSSIENLKRASRVKNSNIFEIEQKNNYNPSQPKILDGRPLGTPIQGNAFNRASINSLVTVSTSPVKSETPTPTPDDRSNLLGMVRDAVEGQHFNPIAPLSPSKNSLSPAKSSLSKRTGAQLRRSGFDPVTGIWEDNDDEEKILPAGKGLHRHAKSVTFDHEPPQINEYEMATPDPSSVASGSREGSYESFDDDEDRDLAGGRGSSVDIEDSFDASLEDTDKTPVVLPEDWRFLSPETANTQLALQEDDVFENHDVGSPAPSARPGSGAARPIQTSTASVDSNGQTRPLPPLPAKDDAHRSSLSGALERLSGAHRALPTPPLPATILSKEDVRRMSNATLSLEDRVVLLQVNDTAGQAETDAQRERRMRRASSREISPLREQFAAAGTLETAGPERCAQPATHGTEPNRLRISRDSIMQGLRDEDDISTSDSQRSLYSQVSSYDPDTPIPSREDPTQAFEDDEASEIVIKEEPLDDDELYAIPDMYSRISSAETSHYSINSSIQHSILGVGNGRTTANVDSVTFEKQKSTSTGSVSLPEFEGFGRKTSFNFGLDEFTTKDQPAQSDVPKVNINEIEPQIGNLPNLAALRDEITRPFTPDLTPPKPAFASEEEESEPSTPSSVIHHPLPKSITPFSDHEDLSAEERRSDSPPPVPPKPDSALTTQIGLSDSNPIGGQEHVFEVNNSTEQPEDTTEPVKREGKRVSSLVQLEIPRAESGDDLGLSLATEFDRVVESQKRGYLMRQNTKLVVASERSFHEEPRSVQHPPQTPAVAEANEIVTSPRNVSQPSWTSEPWNSKSRRKSLRLAVEDAPLKRKEPVPPLPNQTSAVGGLGAVAEDELAEEEAEDLEDGAERGRLFIKVVGVKDLELPFPTHQKTQFALTLDNGLHCVTTAWLDLAKRAPIGQEFELVVLNELEFQLTLQMKLEKPPPPRAESPIKPQPSPKKQSALGRLFGSPKKKKDSDIRPIEPEQRRPITPPSTYELVQGLVAEDGSFGRAYVSLSEFEKQAYGRPYTVDVGCFNEWAMESVPVGSSRSKKGVIQLQRRPPYEIGKLEVQLLYVPKPKGVKDDDMPKSMNGAIRAMREAEEKLKQQAEIKAFEGYLSQQGGDCPYWRRRFFKLVGTKLTAYHETTRQPRATINLAKAAKLIDDKANLTQKETSSRGGKRRKSAFADDEEGYMFVEEGFRLRFANGEVIDFYADNALGKEEWMAALSQVVGKNIPSASTSVKGWTDAVLKREKSMGSKSKDKPRKSSKELSTATRRQSAAVSQPFVSATSASPVELLRSPQLEKVQHFASGAVRSPQKHQSSIPRPHGHVRGESLQADMPNSSANSPAKPRVSAAERHRKTMSMWG